MSDKEIKQEPVSEVLPKKLDFGSSGKLYVNC